MTAEGYYIGGNAQSRENSYIEPGAMIGHDVIVGNNCGIHHNITVKNAVIENSVVIQDNVLIGYEGFTLFKDNTGRTHIPTFENAQIGNYVEIGPNATIHSRIDIGEDAEETLFIENS